MELILFGTSACHLCEQAEKIIAAVQQDFPQIRLTPIDIAEHTQWQDAYAVRIPVLYHEETRREMGWPFDENDVITFIHELNND